YGSETFATEVSSTSIKVASTMDTAISHGLTLGFHSLGSGAAASALMVSPSEPGRSTAPPQPPHLSRELSRYLRPGVTRRRHHSRPPLERPTSPGRVLAAHPAVHQARFLPGRAGLLSHSYRWHFPVVID